MSAQGSLGAPGPAAGPPSFFPHPQSQGNGVVMESPLLNPPFLCQQVREQLDAHVLQKKLQLSHGLPYPIQSSLERSVPSLLGYLECAVLQDSTDPLGPLFRAERWQCLEQRLKQKTAHYKWGLPQRVKSLTLGPAVQESSLGPDHLGSFAVQHQGVSLNMDLSPEQGSAAIGAAMCPRKAISPDGSVNSHYASLQMERAKESLHLTPSHWLIAGEPGGHRSTNGLASSQTSRLGSSNFHNEFLNVAGETQGKLGLQGCEREQPNKCTAFIIQEVPSADRFSPQQDTHWMLKPDEVGRDPLLSLRLPPQGASKAKGPQEMEPQENQDHVPRLTSVHPGNRGRGAHIVSKRTILERPPLGTLLSGKVVSGQEESLALQQALRQNSGLARLQERTSLAHCGHCWPYPVAARPGTSLDIEGLGSQTHPFRASRTSETCPEADARSQRAKAFLTGDEKRYFEFHLREMLLHQRWGIPRMVRQSMAKAARLPATIKE